MLFVYGITLCYLSMVSMVSYLHCYGRLTYVDLCGFGTLCYLSMVLYLFAMVLYLFVYTICLWYYIVLFVYGIYGIISTLLW